MAEAASATTPKPRVLVADDEQVIANTLAIILNQAGFEARAVFSGEKAIEALDSFQPDMLISDVIMTGMTGIEAAIITRSKLPNCKILLFSGQAATADLLEKARPRAMSSRFWPSPSIRLICWRSCAVSRLFWLMPIWALFGPDYGSSAYGRRRSFTFTAGAPPYTVHASRFA